MSNVFPPGVQLGERYRVVRIIQNGAVGAVYEVEELASRSRAALKWVRFSAASGAIQRVVAQAERAKELQHPHVARVLEVVREGSSMFVVSELLAGESLQASLSPHLMLRRERIRLLVQVMRGVAAAHASGIVHGGLHPGNVFLAHTHENPPLVAKVLDFGSSQLNAGDHAALAHALRSCANTLGPHVYMSPEQVSGGAEVDARSDVYSLGVLAYQALTGRVPYAADNLIDLAVKLATTVAAPASLLCPELPASLDRVLSAAIARSRDARLVELDGLIRELEAFQPLSSLQEQPQLAGGETALLIRRRVPRAIEPDERNEQTSDLSRTEVSFQFEELGAQSYAEPEPAASPRTPSQPVMVLPGVSMGRRAGHDSGTVLTRLDVPRHYRPASGPVLIPRLEEPRGAARASHSAELEPRIVLERVPPPAVPPGAPRPHQGAPWGKQPLWAMGLAAGLLVVGTAAFATLRGQEPPVSLRPPPLPRIVPAREDTVLSARVARPERPLPELGHELALSADAAAHSDAAARTVSPGEPTHESRRRMMRLARRTMLDALDDENGAREPFRAGRPPRKEDF